MTLTFRRHEIGQATRLLSHSLLRDFARECGLDVLGDTPINHSGRDRIEQTNCVTSDDDRAQGDAAILGGHTGERRNDQEEHSDTTRASEPLRCVARDVAPPMWIDDIAHFKKGRCHNGPELDCIPQVVSRVNNCGGAGEKGGSWGRKAGEETNTALLASLVLTDHKAHKSIDSAESVSNSRDNAENRLREGTERDEGDADAERGAIRHIVIDFTPSRAAEVPCGSAVEKIEELS